MHSFSKLRRTIGVGLLALAASGGGISAERQKKVADAPAAEPAYPMARQSVPVRVDDSPVPARYSAPLPESVAAMRKWLRGEGEPPLSHALDRVAIGDPAWLARLEAASKSIADADQLGWAQLWQAALEFRPVTPRFCSASRNIMNAPPGALRAALAGMFTRHCAGEADTEAVLREDTPPWAVVFFFDRYDILLDPRAFVPRYHPRLGEAVSQIVLAPRARAKQSPLPTSPAGMQSDALSSYDPAEMSATPRSVAFTMAGNPDPRAAEALLEIHARITDREVADQVALAFSVTKNVKGRARLKAACQRLKKDPVCEGGMDAEDFSSLAEIKPDPGTVAKVRQRIAQLQAMGFTRLEKLDPTKVFDEDVGLVLSKANVAVEFDVETGMFPNEHDSLLRSLSMLVGPALEHVIYEEKAPRLGDEREPYQLTAYSNGKRFRRPAQNLGDWYDLSAVLDLLNAVAAERQLPERFHLLATFDQIAMVVAAPPAAIDKAVEARLIALGDPGQAEASGKAFEEEVRQQIERGED